MPATVFLLVDFLLNFVLSCYGVLWIQKRCEISNFHAQELHMDPICHFVDLKNLKTVTLDGARVAYSCFQIISTSCKFLVEIGLGKCKGVTDKGILELVSGCSNLKILNLTCCSDITDSAIMAIAESCEKLVCLKLECCNLLTDMSFYSLGSFCFILEELDLTDCSGVNDVGNSSNYLGL